MGAGANERVAPPWWGVCTLLVVVAGMLALVVSLSVVLGGQTSSGGIPKANSGFETNGGPLSEGVSKRGLRTESLAVDDHDFVERVCPCNAETEDAWLPGTDERILSNTYMAQPQDKLDAAHLDPRNLSNYAWAWGQFIDHDVVLSASDTQASAFSVPMTPHDDVVLRVSRVQVRTTAEGCTESRNTNSPAIDASTVYGDYMRPNLLAQLREGGGTLCKLRTRGHLLPLSPTRPTTDFLAGDERATEQPLLFVLHAIFVHEHNRICDVLKHEMRLDWTEEERFWKARQIVIAKMHHITYHEWLPALMGSQYTPLMQQSSGNTTPTKGTGIRIASELATSAFRFGHSMVPQTIAGMPLRDVFFKPSVYGTPSDASPFHRFVRAGYEERARRVDTLVSDSLRNTLFAVPGAIVGEDLVVRNLLRARETRSATYAQIAHCYGLQATRSPSPDPLLGMLSEPLVAGSSLPRTIAHVIAEQFRRLRVTAPTQQQLGMYFSIEVRSTTLARLLREHTSLDVVPQSVRNAFYAMGKPPSPFA